MGIHAVYTLSVDDPEARHSLALFHRHGYAGLEDLTIERVFWLEGEVDLDRLMPLLVNTVYQRSADHSLLDPAAGPIIEIAYRPAVTDPETPSIMAGARALGETGLAFSRLSKRFQFKGLAANEARKLAARFLYNPVVQRIRESQEVFVTLRPTGTPDPVATVSFQGLSDVDIGKLSRDSSWYAPLSQMRALQAHEAARGRAFTDAEVEILAQSWSDHCYHTTWKGLGLLKRLSAATAKINHPLVVSSFEDNAGGIEFYDGWVLTIKGETHNFPSSIAPFGGIATKHGGVIRDTLGFGKGGYPIGGTTIMGTMDPRIKEDEVPAGALHPELILTESIRATAYYMNPMGIPMMHPVYRCHPGYAKCLALGHSVGLIPRQYVEKGKPRPGDLALLLGGATGRDGIHGATASSTGMTGETLAKESAAVQIGHPITERRFTTVIPILRDAGFVQAITDLGAGGISCAAGEMGAETGVELNLDAVPLKDKSLTAWEILLSESQERMLVALAPEKLAEAETILDRYEVAHAVIGRFTATRRLEASWRGQKVVDLEMAFLWGGCPIDPISMEKPTRRLSAVDIPEPRTAADWSGAVRRVLTHYHCCDQSAAGAQFDSTVQGRTVVGPYSGRNHQMPSGIYVSAPLRGKPYGMITTVAFAPLYGDVDPATMAKLMMIEAITKAVVAGVDYRDMVLCDNFYTPRVRPEVAWDLRRMVETIADFSVEIGVPFISGKDSSSGTFEADGVKIEVPATLAVSVLGRLPDVGKVVSKDLKRAGNRIVLVGKVDPSALSGTVYADTYGQRGDRLYDAYSAAAVRALWDGLVELHRQGHYVSGSAIGEGGLFLRLFEASWGSGLGVRLTPDSVARGGRRDGLLFGEFMGSVLLEVAPEVDLPAVLHAVPYGELGWVMEEPHLEIATGGKTVWREDTSALAECWSKPFREVVG